MKDIGIGFHIFLSYDMLDVLVQLCCILLSVLLHVL